MKKILFIVTFVCGGFVANAQQTTVQVLYPTAIASGYEHSFADWASTPDMKEAANRVIAPVVIARDGSATADSLMCEASTQDLTGKIALLFRGDCEFGDKAVNAYNQGAVGIIVVGHTTGEIINMSAGTNLQGDVVDVPVVFIKKEDGAAIYDALMLGDSVSVLLGNKIGFMPNDIGSVPGFTANVPAQVPVQIAADTDDFPIRFAAQAYNYGANNQTNIYVTAVINKDGNEFYRDTSNVIPTLVSGDSTDQFAFTDYEGPLGLGDYEIIYEFVSDSIDDSPNDNKFQYPFRINDDKLFSYAKYDHDSSFTFNSGNYGPSERTGDFSSCITFQDPKASEFGIRGVHFQASVKDDLPIDGEEILVQVFKWNDQFTFGVDEPSFTDLPSVTGGSYIYQEDLQNQFVYADMEDYIMLDDNQRYLICLKIYNENVYVGYDNETKYDYYQSIVERYLTPIANGSTWYAAGFQGGPMPSLTLDLFTADEVGLKNAAKLIAANVYPNPATDIVNVVVKNYEGAATLTVTDLAGKIVISNDVAVNANGAITINTASLTAGMYIVNMKLANGNEVKASVVVE